MGEENGFPGNLERKNKVQSGRQLTSHLQNGARKRQAQFTANVVKVIEARVRAVGLESKRMREDRMDPPAKLREGVAWEGKRPPPQLRTVWKEA